MCYMKNVQIKKEPMKGGDRSRDADLATLLQPYLDRNLRRSVWRRADGSSAAEAPHGGAAKPAMPRTLDRRAR